MWGGRARCGEVGQGVGREGQGVEREGQGVRVWRGRSKVWGERAGATEEVGEQWSGL